MNLIVEFQTNAPTRSPTASPTSLAPTGSPTPPTFEPTSAPTRSPTVFTPEEEQEDQDLIIFVAGGSGALLLGLVAVGAIIRHQRRRHPRINKGFFSEADIANGRAVLNRVGNNPLERPPSSGSGSNSSSGDSGFSPKGAGIAALGPAAGKPAKATKRPKDLKPPQSVVAAPEPQSEIEVSIQDPEEEELVVPPPPAAPSAAPIVPRPPVPHVATEKKAPHAAAEKKGAKPPKPVAPVAAASKKSKGPLSIASSNPRQSEKLDVRTVLSADVDQDIL